MSHVQAQLSWRLKATLPFWLMIAAYRYLSTEPGSLLRAKIPRCMPGGHRDLRRYRVVVAGGAVATFPQLFAKLPETAYAPSVV